VELLDLSVLAVDDNATNRAILEETLSNSGIKVSVADSGESALALMEAASREGHPFALVLLDSHMPGMDGFGVARRIRENPDLAEVRLIMLTSGESFGDVARCRENKIDSYLIKPVRPSELLDRIRAAMGAQPSRPAHLNRLDGCDAEEDIRSLRVLLAEDNPVNQKLALRLLEKRRHTVFLAGDGREALALLEKESFDLILMDLQMPNLDGLEATAQIRIQEQGTGRHVPIVAMTAHAMVGDKERCLAGGMDGYVSKPVQPSELYQVIKNVVDKSRRKKSNVSDETTIDLDFALTRVDGDIQLLREIASLFSDECGKLMSQIESSLNASDGKALSAAAHTMKGMLGNFGAKSAVDAAFSLEQSARNGDLARALTAYTDLRREVERAKPCIERLGREVAA
jgi:CheY-like chemotaxis protein/HPt (histidine-containing phosphotransfer) domain-containing protein